MYSNELSEFSSLRLLLSVEGIGSKKISALINKFRSPTKVFDALPHSLAAVEGVGQLLASRIIAASKNLEHLRQTSQQVLETCNKKNISVLTIWDEEYPHLLKNISDPPIVLYAKGKMLAREINPVAIVGTRSPSQYGKNQAERVSIILAQKNITVVSGLARGIDSIAHRGALSTGGRTVAVLGSGVDVIYPPENRDLAHEILENGMLLSEFEPGTRPDAMNFPRRNRIISGISLGTIIIESAINGGAMQTAMLSLDQNREVFAVPGNIGTRQAEGPNILIQRGEAKLITSAEDVLSELRIEGGNNVSPQITVFDLNIFEEKIMGTLNKETPNHIDSIAQNAGMSTSDSLIYLLSLEFKGAVKQLPGKMFISVC